MRSGKLKPIDDKLKNSRMNDKQKYIFENSGSNVIKLIM